MRAWSNWVSSMSGWKCRIMASSIKGKDDIGPNSHSFAAGPESTTGSRCGKRLGWRNCHQPDASLYSGGPTCTAPCCNGETHSHGHASHSKLNKNFSIASALSSRRGSKMLFSLLRATSMTGHTSTCCAGTDSKDQKPLTWKDSVGDQRLESAHAHV